MAPHAHAPEAGPSHGSREVLPRVPPLLLPMLALLAVGALVVLWRDRVRDRSLARQKALAAVEIHCRTIERELEAVTAVLLHLAEQRIAREFLAGRAPRAAIESEYVHLCQVSGIFDQIRVIGEDGRETLRVNYRGGAPAAVAVAELQSKADRYYVQLARPTSKGHVYISPFDLNLEHGRIEEPWKPVLRLATPLFDDAGERRGILVLNYLGQSLLERLAGVAAQTPGWTGLVDRDGYYLVAPEPERSWGFMFGQPPSFAADHPTAWAAIGGHGAGSFQLDQGLFTYRTITPPGALRDTAQTFPSGLRVVSFVPTDAVYAASWGTFQRLAAGAAVVAIVLFGVAWRLAHAGALRERHEQRIEASEARLRVLSRRLLDAQESERKSLARDLHDEVGQLAAAVTIDLERARRARDAAAKDELIERSLEGTAHLLASMRRISSRMRSSILDDLGLKTALRSCGEELERHSGIPVALELDFEDGELAEGVAEHVYRIVQEALTNVTRHARASDARVRVWRHDGLLSLTVSDRGVGFDPGGTDPRRLGLLGMRERAELLGGTLEVRSAPMEGTLVRATIPLDAPEPLEPPGEGREERGA